MSKRNQMKNRFLLTAVLSVCAFFFAHSGLSQAQAKDLPDFADLVEKHGPGLKLLKTLYIDCGDIDQYNLVYGARRMHKRLDHFGVPHTYEEFPDNHSSVDYRMDVSLPILAKSLWG